ncbi:MAG: hypothetical protein VYD77_04700 [Actinomycetota bacterium]|nr:hypothetical protein [Actinomycetota bacterium]
MRSVNDIPVAHTPDGGWTDFPELILEHCVDELIDNAIDMRGMWEVTEVLVENKSIEEHFMIGSMQRIEQAADRVVITSSGVIHDMRCDGTVKNGVNDVAADFIQRISVIATFENGVHILRPVDMPIEVRRYFDGPMLVWEYGPFFTAHLKKISDL